MPFNIGGRGRCSRHAMTALPAAAALAAFVATCGATEQGTKSSPVPSENTLLWPKPQSHVAGDAVLRVVADGFAFSSSVAGAPAVRHGRDGAGNGGSGGTGRRRDAGAIGRSERGVNAGRPVSILAAAVGRYRPICFPAVPAAPPAPRGSAASEVIGLTIAVDSADASLTLETSERYTLRVAAGNATLHADTVFGALRGLETFAQLVQPDLTIREAAIEDWPRFPFRAVLIDTSRHYLPVKLIEAHIDAMSYNKINVLHWHITDMPSFPWVSTKFPGLSARGAFSPSHVYSPSDVSGLVEYGVQRGVMIVVELDSPGHTFPSWGAGGPPDLLTSCPSPETNNTGPLRADRDQTYAFLTELLTEVGAAFPGQVFHAGGDEVSFGCWGANADVRAWMASHGMGANLTLLNNHYVSKLLGIVTGPMNRSAMLWRPGAADSLDQTTVPKGTVFDVYGAYPKSSSTSVPGDDYGIAASRTTANGHRVVRSAGMYLDQLCDIDPDGKHRGTYWGFFQGWVYYNASHDPLHGLDPSLGARPELVIGGKANMWGEHVDAANFMPRVWPRASVVAERLWSAANVTDVAEAEPRLHEFRCKMVGRGIAASPIGAFSYGESGPYHKCYCQTELDFQYAPPAPAPAQLVVGGPVMALVPPRRELAAAAVGSRLVFAGGLASDGGNVTDAVDVFDVANGGRRTALKLSAARAFDGGQNVAAVCRGKVYIAGGAYANGTKSDVVDVYDSATGEFEPPLKLSAGRSFLAAAALDKAGLVFFGGGELAEDEKYPENSADADVVDVWSVEKQAWLAPGRLSVGRKKLTATTVGDDVVLFAGGFRSNMAGLGYRAEVDIYNATTGVWSTARLAQGRMRLASASAGDCAVFAGGEVNTTNNDGSGIVDLYCGGSWSVTELSIRRYEHASAAVGGKIYFGGGNGGVRNLNPLAGTRVDVFDAATREWSHLDLPTPRDRLGAAATEDGGGLVCFSGGGADGAQLDCLHAGLQQ